MLCSLLNSDWHTMFSYASLILFQILIFPIFFVYTISFKCTPECMVSNVNHAISVYYFLLLSISILLIRF